MRVHPSLCKGIHMEQASIDFAVHRRENSPESQRHLDAKRGHFTAKCAVVYQRLMAGERLTVLGCANSGVSSLPRRLLDLKQSGVHVSDAWENGCKVWFLSADDLAFNRWTFRDQAA